MGSIVVEIIIGESGPASLDIEWDGGIWWFLLHYHPASRHCRHPQSSYRDFNCRVSSKKKCMQETIVGTKDRETQNRARWEWWWGVATENGRVSPKWNGGTTDLFYMALCWLFLVVLLLHSPLRNIFLHFLLYLFAGLYFLFLHYFTAIFICANILFLNECFKTTIFFPFLISPCISLCPLCLSAYPFNDNNHVNLIIIKMLLFSIIVLMFSILIRCSRNSLVKVVVVTFSPFLLYFYIRFLWRPVVKCSVVHRPVAAINLHYSPSLLLLSRFRVVFFISILSLYLFYNGFKNDGIDHKDEGRRKSISVIKK